MVCFSTGECKQSKKFRGHCLGFGWVDLGLNSASAIHQPDDLKEDT